MLARTDVEKIVCKSASTENTAKARYVANFGLNINFKFMLIAIPISSTNSTSAYQAIPNNPRAIAVIAKFGITDNANKIKEKQMSKLPTTIFPLRLCD